MKSNSFTSHELFVDGVKAAEDMQLCTHFTFASYNKWDLDYLITTTICSPLLNHHT
jgi:hypothetical protein